MTGHSALMFSYPTPGAKAAATDNRTGRRAAARLRVTIPGRLILLGGSYTCEVGDISQTGARVHCEAAAVDPGATGVLQCMGLDVLCCIVRRDGRCVGLAFEEDVSAEALQEIRQQHDRLSKVRVREDRIFAKRWATGVYT
ncbi:PilZ domain-containing protein [Allopontixanthobacter sediminis]|uniref:PilZ domain-containing protein n=1 Tax=Allopontixanthobacter sediminis TaxID=1689985 RepID=A0A845B3G4_9SPHN|nr:PilZ domain-containing protein [Allopontixanthobacter sediminis]MXP43967.1 hypothetical protein [Allopontixanthobacter sediminis]